MLSVCITTAPRGIMYTGLTLWSYFDEFKVTPHVFEELDTPKYDFRSKCTIHQNGTTLGCVKNWLNAVEQMLVTTNTPFIMTMEDDVQWQPGSGVRVEKLLNTLLSSPIMPVNTIGFISPYCSKMNTPTDKGWRKPRFLKSGWGGALSLIFPRHALERIVNNKDRFLMATVDERFPDKGFIHLDYAIGKFLQDDKLILLTHSPTLVTHLGEVSTFPRNNEERNKNHFSRIPNL